MQLVRDFDIVKTAVRGAKTAVLLALATACTSTPATTATAFGAQSPDSTLTAPLRLQLEITVTATIDEVLTGTALAEANRTMGIPEDTSPTLKLWSADLQDHFGQQDVKLLECEPKPTRTEIDPENGNRIFLWDFSRDLKSSQTLKVRRRYTLTNCFYDPHVTSATVGNYKPDDSQVAFYTASEPYLELTDDITSAARIAVGDETNPLEKARRIFQYVRKHMTYAYPPPGGRGASIALACGKGDCGQYADLFTALCRAQGLPARMGAGFHLFFSKSGDGQTTVGSHAWAELMLPDGSWVPVDPTVDEDRYFARKLDNTHITASVGRNIRLPEAPESTTYALTEMEHGRTPFMQSCTEFLSGVKGKVSVSRRAVKLNSAD
ncbi:MAG: transglutaminase-like domain-containing protein [Candidatus Sumerlaeaceae bacterium]|nr:transglutaminase-like domain-containing protein [Candidatus Sumerlaeaceae bacterium]